MSHSAARDALNPLLFLLALLGLVMFVGSVVEAPFTDCSVEATAIREIVTQTKAVVQPVHCQAECSNSSICARLTALMS
jgi:hypothetical protein